MKKLISILMVVAIVFSCVSCGNKNNTDARNEEKSLITFLPVEENYIMQYYAATESKIPNEISEIAWSIGATGEIKQSDLLCYVADVTGDGTEDLIVNGGAVYGVYTLKNGIATRIYDGYDGIMASGISLVKYNGKYYTKCESGSSSTGFGVSLIHHSLDEDKEDTEAFSSRTVFDENLEVIGYEVNGKMVSYEEYEKANASVCDNVEYYSAEKIKEKALVLNPVKNDNIDYNAVYENFIKQYKEQIGTRSGNITRLDTMYPSIDVDEYKPETGYVAHSIKDFNGDGVTDIITVQEYMDNSMDCGAITSLYIKAYTISDEKIVLMDSFCIGGLLPFFSFVDVCEKDNFLTVSGIGAWWGDPGYNDHWIIKLSGTELDIDYISSMDIYDWGEGIGEENIKYANQINGYGFRYEAGDCGGLCDKNAKRLALYSLDGTNGRYVEYFDGTVNESAGFYNYIK